MEPIEIAQNRRNTWTLIGIPVTIFSFVIISHFASMFWPPKFDLRWFIVCLFYVFTSLALIDLLIAVFAPREEKIKITNNKIFLEEHPFFKAKYREFLVSDIKEITHGYESASYIKTIDGKKHPLSEILMMKHKEIFEVISSRHPQINLKEKG